MPVCSGISAFSSPEPSGSHGELIVHAYSSVRPSSIRRSVCQPFSKTFSSETTWPVKAKILLGPPWEGEHNVDPGGVAAPAPGQFTSPLFPNNLSETAQPIKDKFDVEPPWEKGLYLLRWLCHMTRMTVMPIYDQNLEISEVPFS